MSNQDVWKNLCEAFSDWGDIALAPLDRHGRILGWSEKLRNWTGYDASAVHRKRVSVLFPGAEVPSLSSDQAHCLSRDVRLMDSGDYFELTCAMWRLASGVTYGIMLIQPTVVTESGNCDFYGIITRSAKMQHLFQLVRRVGQSDVTALVRGESGSGKELLARAIHMESPRRDNVFLAVNCATISPQLVNSELFGHKKGAFTGANSDHKGFFERADGGTLFLDEVGELPLAAQANLLRALQEQCFTPVGGNQLVNVNVRIIAATNRALRKEVLAGRFREDLLYRIRILPLYLPSLRERKEDIPILIQHFLEQQEVPKKISVETLNLLMSYDWPGNVRELQNVMTYGYIISRGVNIKREDLPPEFQEIDPILHTRFLEPKEREEEPFKSSGVESVAGVEEPTDEASLIRYILGLTDGDISRAAEIMGISRSTFWRRRRDLNL